MESEEIVNQVYSECTEKYVKDCIRKAIKVNSDIWRERVFKTSKATRKALLDKLEDGLYAMDFYTTDGLFDFVKEFIEENREVI